MTSSVGPNHSFLDQNKCLICCGDLEEKAYQWGYAQNVHHKCMIRTYEGQMEILKAVDGLFKHRKNNFQKIYVHEYILRAIDDETHKLQGKTIKKFEKTNTLEDFKAVCERVGFSVLFEAYHFAVKNSPKVAAAL